MSVQDDLLAKARKPAEDALRLHPFYGGKIQMLPKCPVRSFHDFSIWYTPGVAAPCRAIHDNPEAVYEHTNKGNTVAVVSDGTRVLGLGKIGPEAGLPVMEGKALLFKHLGGVDAVPICVRTQTAEELIQLVEALEPSFGGINLEDIEQPKCFRVLDELRRRMRIPVWHDDQQGTATVALAGLTTALKVVGKDAGTVRITLIGVGAANVANYRLLVASGIDPAAICACDSRGTLHPEREDIERRQEEYTDKWRICRESNADRIVGGAAEALAGADVCLAFSSPGPDTLRPEWIGGMARDAIVFACANPLPEIWPWDAKQAGARIVATGRGDFPNQVNNSLGFPAIFRGALDVRASAITDEMALAAARTLAACAERQGLHEERIVIRMDEWQAYTEVAVAVALAAQEQGVAARQRSRAELETEATARIRAAREQLAALVEAGLIPQPPAEEA